MLHICCHRWQLHHLQPDVANQKGNRNQVLEIEVEDRVFRKNLSSPQQRYTEMMNLGKELSSYAAGLSLKEFKSAFHRLNSLKNAIMYGESPEDGVSDCEETE